MVLTRGVALPFTLDTIDRQIVSLLIDDGRISSAEITRRIGHVSERAVRYRIERLIRSGVIRISAVVMPQAVGFPVIGDVLVDVAPRIEPDGVRRIGEFMKGHLDGFATLYASVSYADTGKLASYPVTPSMSRPSAITVNP